MNKNDVAAALPAVGDLLAALVPGALGATAAVLVQGAMSWTQRLIQLSVGIVVSYYVGEIAAEIFSIGPMVKQGIGFTAGIGAFEAVKRLRVTLGVVAAGAPKDLWDALKRKLGISE